MKKTRKAFTLVELLVVIAILAVLATVGIVGYTSFTKKAKESNDRSVVSQLNVALQAYETTDGAPKTMHEALKVVEESGFNVAKLTPDSEGYDYVYDMKNNRFALCDKSGAVVVEASDKPFSGNGVDAWMIAHTESEKEKFGRSTYLANDYPGNSISVTKGVDLGDNTNVQNVSYTNTTSTAQKVIIRTNAGSLTVNAPKDTVMHYGEGETLSIIAVASASYHENGTFTKASIAKGRIVVEQEGNIPAVEITAIPTVEAPIIIETNNDIVVSASTSVVESLGANTLENVEVKVSSSEANIVIDEKVSTSSVEVNGQAATADDFVSITKVASLSQLLSALSNNEKYIMFSNDIATNGSDLINITYSTTIDGNGYKLTGNGGLRNSTPQMICIGWNATELIEKVIVKNLTIETTTVTRPLECRGNTKEIVFDNIKMNAGGSGNDQGFTFGGNYADLMKLTVKNSDIAVGNDGYAFLFFNAVDMLIENSTITGWAGLYFKAPNSSHGARNSKVVVNNSSFICHNVYSAASNDFGAIVFEDGSIDVSLNNTSIDVTREGTNQQAAVVFSSKWASQYGVDLKECKVSFKDITILGTINSEEIQYDSSNVVMIQSGMTTLDPSSYLPEESSVQYNGVFYLIQYR